MIKLEKGIQQKDALLIILDVLSGMNGTVTYKGQDHDTKELIMPYISFVKNLFKNGSASPKDMFLYHVFSALDIAGNNSALESDFATEFICNASSMVELITDKATTTTATTTATDDDDDDF